MNKPMTTAWKIGKKRLTTITFLTLLFLSFQTSVFGQTRNVKQENGKEIQPKRDLPPSNEMLNSTVKRIEIKQNEVSKIQDISFLDHYTEKLTSICPNIPAGNPFDLTHDQLITWLQSYYGEGSEYMNLLLRIEEDWKANQSSEN